MTFVKKLKLSALNGSFMDRNSVYKLIRDEQYNQYKALNIGMTYLYTHSILKSVGSGEETKLFNKMKKLEIKLLALKEKLKNQEKNSASYIKTLDLVKEHESAIERINLEIDECKNNRIMVDKDFKSMYIDDLYSVLQSQVNFVNKDNMSLVTTKLKKDFASALKLGLANGDCNVINYKRNVPLMVRGRDLKIYKEDDSYYIRWVKGITFKIITGRKDKDKCNIVNLLDDIISENSPYKICESTMGFIENKLILNLNVDKIVEDTIEYDDKIKDRVVGVDLGVKIPAFISLNDDTRIYKSIGSYESFLKVSTQFKETRKRLFRQISKSRGGKGRQRKLKAALSLNKKQSNYNLNYNHYISKEIIKFAVTNKASQINLELLNGKEFKKNKFLSEWSYASLQNLIKYKAARHGIIVKFIDPYNTSITCSKCGNVSKDQRLNQEKFKCVCCGNSMNADRNASINIARSKCYVSSIEDTIYYKNGIVE